jgi:hypothetical protein
VPDNDAQKDAHAVHCVVGVAPDVKLCEYTNVDWAFESQLKRFAQQNRKPKKMDVFRALAGCNTFFKKEGVIGRKLLFIFGLFLVYRYVYR